MSYGAVTVGTSAVAVPGAGSYRVVYNNSSAPLYRGDDSSVTTATGTPILPGGNWKSAGPMFLIAGSAGNDARWCHDS